MAKGDSPETLFPEDTWRPALLASDAGSQFLPCLSTDLDLQPVRGKERPLTSFLFITREVHAYDSLPPSDLLPHPSKAKLT